ncbi:hypothetical protein BASA81_010172 [Batrachochytrium salamandrivorans]|nr:hypothetical protein BASA81_010172 [Batrachochytrium salamandrivorans]
MFSRVLVLGLVLAVVTGSTVQEANATAGLSESEPAQTGLLLIMEDPQQPIPAAASSVSATAATVVVTSEHQEHLRRQDAAPAFHHPQTMLDAVVFALSLVLAVLVLPLALAYRLLPQFRNAVLALTGYQSHHLHKRVGGTGGGGELDPFKEDGVFQPQLLPTTFRSMLRGEDVLKLLVHLPTNVTYKDWQLLYASELHGFNLYTAYKKCQDMGPCLLVVMDFDRHVMAAYVSETLQPVNGRRFFGNGECFVASLFPKFEAHHYKPTSSSVPPQEFVMATDSFLAFGGGGKAFALWMDSSFDRATSEPNEVFGNTRSLASAESFKCAAVEIWSFALPKLSLRTKAMSAVLGRMKQ